MNSRSKLAVALCIAGFCICLTGQTNAQDQWRLGMQAYSFNRFTFYEAVEKNKTLGMDVIEAYPGQKLSDQQRQDLTQRIPMNCLGTPEDVAGVAESYTGQFLKQVL